MDTVKVVTVSVYNKVIEDPTSKEIITANDFKVQVKDVASLNKRTILKKSDAKAIDLLTNKQVDITGVTHEIKGVVGKYPVKLTTKKGTTTTITVEVVSNGALPPEIVDNKVIYASSFSIDLETYKTLTNENIIKYAGARGESTTGEVFVPKTNKPFIDAKGIYNVTFYADGAKDKTVEILVTDKGITDENQNVLFANNFSIDLKELVDRKDNDIIIKKAKAVSYNLETSNKNELEVIIPEDANKLGVYPIKFVEKNGTNELIVNMKVLDESNTSTEFGVDETIYTNEFSIGLNEVKDISKEMFIKRSNANAVENNTGKEVEVVDYVIEKYKPSLFEKVQELFTISLNASGITIDKTGKYNVKFMTENDTIITTVLTVFNQGIQDDTNYMTINDYDGLLNEYDNKVITQDSIKGKLKYNFIELNTGAKLELKKVSPLNITTYGLSDAKVFGTDALSLDVKLNISELMIDMKNPNVEIKLGSQFNPRDDINAYIKYYNKTDDVNSLLKIDNKVDTNKVGTYEVNYEVSNGAQRRILEKKTRIVNVVSDTVGMIGDPSVSGSQDETNGKLSPTGQMIRAGLLSLVLLLVGILFIIRRKLLNSNK